MDIFPFVLAHYGVTLLHCNIFQDSKSQCSDDFDTLLQIASVVESNSQDIKQFEIHHEKTTGRYCTCSQNKCNNIKTLNLPKWSMSTRFEFSVSKSNNNTAYPTLTHTTIDTSDIDSATHLTTDHLEEIQSFGTIAVTTSETELSDTRSNTNIKTVSVKKQNSEFTTDGINGSSNIMLYNRCNVLFFTGIIIAILYALNSE